MAAGAPEATGAGPSRANGFGNCSGTSGWPRIPGTPLAAVAPCPRLPPLGEATRKVLAIEIDSGRRAKSMARVPAPYGQPHGASPAIRCGNGASSTALPPHGDPPCGSLIDVDRDGSPWTSLS